MDRKTEHLTTCADATRALGRALGAALRGPAVVALYGPLGAGKTVFVQGLAAGLGVPDDEAIVSPTFVLIREYAGRLTLVHCDAYRVRSASELWEAGLGERLEAGEDVIAIEWADRVESLLPDRTIRVELAHAGGETRRIVCSNLPANLLDAWNAPRTGPEPK